MEIIAVPDSAFRRSLIFAAGGLGFALLMIVGGNYAYACEVLSLPSIQEAYDSSPAIFAGRVADFQKSTIEGIDKRIAFFEVDRYWKSLDGNDYKELIVTTAIDHGACGYDYSDSEGEPLSMSLRGKVPLSELVMMAKSFED